MTPAKLVLVSVSDVRDSSKTGVCVGVVFSDTQNLGVGVSVTAKPIIVNSVLIILDRDTDTGVGVANVSDTDTRILNVRKSDADTDTHRRCRKP